MVTAMHLSIRTLANWSADALYAYTLVYTPAYLYAKIKLYFNVHEPGAIRVWS